MKKVAWGKGKSKNSDPHRGSQEGLSHVIPSSPVHYGECMNYSSPAPVTALVTALVTVAMKVPG